MYLSCIQFINSASTRAAHPPPRDTLTRPSADQNRHPALALTDARRHLRRKNMGQGQLRNDQDVPGRSPRQAPSRAALPIRVHPSFHWRPPPTWRPARPERSTLRPCAPSRTDGRRWARCRNGLGRLLRDPDSFRVRSRGCSCEDSPRSQYTAGPF